MDRLVGRSEDIFVAYEEYVDGRLERTPAWRYISKNALHSPDVEFRKIVDEAEKEQKNKP